MKKIQPFQMIDIDIISQGDSHESLSILYNMQIIVNSNLFHFLTHSMTATHLRFHKQRTIERMYQEEEYPGDQAVHSQLMAVIIPPDCYAGHPLNIQTPDGRIFQIAVPNGSQPGQTLTVEILDDAVGGSKVIVAEDTIITSSRNESVASAVGAAAVGAVIGTILLGPITGIVVAGAAIYASTRNDKIGETTRATGSAAVSLYDKTVQAAEKYHVKEKVSTATEATVKKANEINDQYKVTDQIQSATKEMVKGAQELDQKYDISGKTVSFFHAGAKAAASTLSKLSDSSSSSPSSPSSPGTTATATALPPPYK
jgi:hypothetical protein